MQLVGMQDVGIVAAIDGCTTSVTKALGLHFFVSFLPFDSI